MTDLSGIQDKLAAMANALLTDTPEDDRLDVFKVVSTWHIAMRKVTKGEDDDGADRFDAVRNKLRSVG